MLRINDRTYYFNQTPDAVEGKMVTGWYQDAAGKWYFFSTTADSTEGAAVTGWQWVDGRSYYFELAAGENTGKMFANDVTPDGYKVNADGQWVDENGNVKTRSESDFTTIQKSTTTVTRSSGSGGGSSHSSSSSSGNSGSSDNSGNSSNSGKDDTGKDDTGKDDTGKDDSGKDDSGKDDTGKDDSGKDDTGNGGDSGKDDSGNTDKPDDKPEETKILTGEAEVASNEYGSVSGTYQVKVKVTVDKEITEDFLKKMAAGVPILDTVTRPCTVKKIGKYTFSIILTQGLNRQIRRMCEALGYEVKDLLRVRVMNITLDGLKDGQYRKLTDQELNELYDQLKDSSALPGGKYQEQWAATQDNRTRHGKGKK